MAQLPLGDSTDRVLAEPDQGVRPIVRVAIGFAMALVGAVVALILLT